MTSLVPQSFIPGYRLQSGTDLNEALANPQWSTTMSLEATTGGTAATSAKIVNTITNITSATAGAGVTIPRSAIGKYLHIINSSANTVNVYAEGDATINGIAGTFGYDLPAGQSITLYGVDTTSWLIDDASGGAQDYFDTIAALKAVTPTAGQFAEVGGYYAVGDGGGGQFYGVTAGGPYTDNGGTVIVPTGGDGSIAWLRVYSEAINVLWFGAYNNNTNESLTTQAIKNACLVDTAIFFPRGTYRVSYPETQSLGIFSNKTSVTITGDSALIYDAHDYSTESFNPVFSFISCSNITVTGLNYEGQPLPFPSTPNIGVGYAGATFVNLSQSCTNIYVSANLKYLRYGIRAGSFSTASDANNNNIRADLTTLQCGYPVALYGSDTVDLNIYADQSHRSVYLAGVQNGRVFASFKDNFIAPLQVLLTDTILAAGSSKGCKNLEVFAYDRGSTNYVANSYCAGISLQRNDPDITYENIRFNIYVKSTDTIAATLGAFNINSSVGWTNTIKFKNIIMSGVVDRSAQTVSAPTYETYVVFATGGIAANTSNVSTENFYYTPPSGPKGGGFEFRMTGQTGHSHFTDCDFGTETPFVLQTNVTSSVDMQNCILRGSWQLSDGNNIINFSNCKIASALYQGTTNKTFVNSSIQGTGSNIKIKIIESSVLSGASVTLTGAIPAASVVFGINGIITEEITGATGFLLGTPTSTSLYANRNSLLVGTAFPAIGASTATTPLNYAVATDLVITPKTSNFTAGKIRIAIFYLDFTNFTS